MRLMKYTVVMAAALMMGCASGKGPKEPTAKETMHTQWNNARAGVLFNLAKQQFESGNLDDARKSLNDALSLAPENAAIHILSARVSIERGNLELAERELQAARTLDEKNGEADYYSGIIYQRWQRPETALEMYEKAAAKAPAELAYMLARAEMLVDLNRQDQALDLLKDKLGYFDNSAPLRDAVGQLLMRKGQYAEASGVLRQAAVMAPDEANVREHLAVALYQAKEYSEAAALLEKMMREEGFAKRGDLVTALGECQLMLNRPREARDSFETASALEPGAVSSWLNLAKAAMAINDPARAEMSLRKALSMDGQSPEAQVMLGYLRLKQDRLEESLAAFRKAASLDAKDPVAVCMSGYVLEKQGKPAEAAALYAAALKIRPNDELASALLAKVQVK
jgi:tetratricopeptide (TPR) repeat protein